MTIKIHLDTDLGSDTDDLCALAMLLGWPSVELTGITTSTDPGGVRAGFVAYALGLAGRTDIPVAAGAEGSLGGFFVPLILLALAWLLRGAAASAVLALVAAVAATAGVVVERWLFFAEATHTVALYYRGEASSSVR